METLDTIDSEKSLRSTNEGRKPEEDLIGIEDEAKRLKRKTKTKERKRRPAADHQRTRFSILNKL